MNYRIFGVALGAMFMSLVAPAAQATPIVVSSTGTAACPGAGVTCDITVGAMSGTSVFTDLNPLYLTIDLGTQHFLELFDGSGTEQINLISSGGALLTNTAGGTNTIGVVIEFLDADGNIVNTTTTSIIGLGACGGCGMSVTSFPGSILFHSIVMKFTPATNGISFNFDNFQTIQFNHFATTSNTGRVPEPGTLSIFGLGAMWIGLKRRRKQKQAR